MKKSKCDIGRQYIYVISIPNTVHTKIGITDNWERRAGEYKTSNPNFELNLLEELPEKTAIQIEQAIKHSWKHLLIKTNINAGTKGQSTEWFNVPHNTLKYEVERHISNIRANLSYQTNGLPISHNGKVPPTALALRLLEKIQKDNQNQEVVLELIDEFSRNFELGIYEERISNKTANYEDKDLFFGELEIFSDAVYSFYKKMPISEKLDYMVLNGIVIYTDTENGEIHQNIFNTAKKYGFYVVTNKVLSLWNWEDKSSSMFLLVPKDTLYWNPVYWENSLRRWALERYSVLIQEIHSDLELKTRENIVEQISESNSIPLSCCNPNEMIRLLSIKSQKEKDFITSIFSKWEDFTKNSNVVQSEKKELDRDIVTPEAEKSIQQQEPPLVSKPKGIVVHLNDRKRMKWMLRLNYNKLQRYGGSTFSSEEQAMSIGLEEMEKLKLISSELSKLDSEKSNEIKYMIKENKRFSLNDVIDKISSYK